MLARLSRNLKEITDTAFDICSLRYPGFVYRTGSIGGPIPVFCFRGVDAESFDAMLRFLSMNGYTTLSADEYYDMLIGNRPVSARPIVLTFDEGWGSLWSIAFPLLLKYGIKIVVFLSPGRIVEQQSQWPNLDDLMAGRCCKADILKRDISNHPLLTWEEIAAMHRSGLVDFQSHAYSHSPIYRSARVVDFVNPDLLSSTSLLELPCPAEYTPIRTFAGIRLGEPLYETAPRLSDIPRLMVDPLVAEECVSFVANHDADSFFKSSNWRIELALIARNSIGVSDRTWWRETSSEQVRAIRFELLESRRAIEDRLPGKSVKHICYPWHAAGSIAVRETPASGYLAAFWNKVDDRYSTPIFGNPYRIARVSGDFLCRLPGKGRMGLFKILFTKAIRRIRKGSLYLTR
jgi:hypothetical protein